MPRRWTPEQRAAQAEAIRRWKPWEKSTGPTSDKGKGVSALNRLKHGLRSRGYLADRKRINDLIRAIQKKVGRSKPY